MKESLLRSDPLRRSVRFLLSWPRYVPFFFRRSAPDRVPQLSWRCFIAGGASQSGLNLASIFSPSG